MLAWTIYSSFISAAVVAFLPPRRTDLIRWFALMAAILGLFFAFAGSVRLSPGRLNELADVDWIPALGISFHLAADGISIALAILTGIAAVAGVLFSWNVETRINEFFAFFFTLIGAVYGVFLSFDLFLFFVFYELAIIPKYFLISIWGSTRKEYGAMKLSLYSFVGSAMVLVGLLAAFVLSGSSTFSLTELAGVHFSRSFQFWAFPLVFVGFAILAGLWPFHTWAPTGHVAAPTAASMLLAGIVMKLGAYGCLRVAMTLFPEGMESWGFTLLGLGSWREVFGLLALVGILYGAMVALVQGDLKFVVGYSSVSHMGFVLLGLMTLNTVGISGAVLQMFSHGIIAGLLFAVVGRMLYDRTHTRQLDELRTMNLSSRLPFAAVTFTLALVASMGLPGFSGFVAELQVLVGAWKAFPGFGVLAGAGVVISVAYCLRALQRAFFAESHDTTLTSTSTEHGAAFDGISTPEKIGAILLLGVSLFVGLYPDCLLRLIRPSLALPMFDWLVQGGGL